MESPCCPTNSHGPLPAAPTDPPTGVMVSLAADGGLEAYVALPPHGRQAHSAVVVGYDIFGLAPVSRCRQLCDLFAAEGNFVVVMPDFFRGSDYTQLDDPARDKIPWIKSVSQHFSDTFETAWTVQILPFLYGHGVLPGHVAVCGLCWGSYLTMRTGAMADTLGVACGVSVHPSHPKVVRQVETPAQTQAELLGAVTCPQLILACGNDPDSVKVGGQDQQVLRAKGVVCECLELSEMRHGFLARGDYAGDAAVRRDAGMCVQRILDFLRTHLPPLPPPPGLRAEIKWGILGVGDVCEIKSGPAFQKCKGSSLQAVMRRTASRAQDFAERHGVPAWYADADALLADPNVNAVYIATPPGSHLELALKCCAAGKPTYLEKPAARNAPETREIVDAFAQAQVPLFVAYYRRGQPKFRKARQLVQEGHLGRLTSASYDMLRPTYRRDDSSGDDSLPWRFRAAHSGGGLIMDVGCHTIDILDFILGPLRDVAGSAGNVDAEYAVEDSVVLHAKFGDAGRPATIAMQWSFAAPPATYADTIWVHGTKGSMRLSTFKDDGILLTTVREEHEKKNGGGDAANDPRRGDQEGTTDAKVSEMFTFAKPQHAHQPLVQMVVDELRGLSSSPSTGSNAIRVAEVIDDALNGFYGGRADAFWEREGRWPGQRVGRAPKE